MENADDLAIILTAEMGKPLAEAKGEIDMALALLNGLQNRQSAYKAKCWKALLRIKNS